MKPVAEACERNRDPILGVLTRVFAYRRSVLEIGSGTGQHAVYFGAALAHLVWQTSDLPQAHPGIRAWLADAGLPNVLAPVTLDVLADAWDVGVYDAFFSSNVAHIASWDAVRAMFRGIARHRADDCVVALYGPYNYGGRFTSPSNAQFDAWLRQRDPASGIRDFEAVDELARAIGLQLLEDNAMPANNRLLVWRSTAVRAARPAL
jgi:hypothetical protein